MKSRGIPGTCNVCGFATHGRSFAKLKDRLLKHFACEHPSLYQVAVDTWERWWGD